VLPPEQTPSQPVVDERHEIVKSPIVGTFYDAPAPGAPPFVRVGDRVEPGQVLCIIESMKLMNEIESEVAGTVVAKLVENGKPVEYGQALFAVLPQ
jgi:acetyl-CoA carboxylase biotin carboxyl carrier protein